MSMTSPVTAPTHPDSIFTDQEEIAHNRNQHVLHCHCDAGSQKTRKGRERRQFSGKAQSSNYHERYPHYDALHQKQLAATPRFVCEAKDSALPDLAQEHDGSQNPNQDTQSDTEGYQRIRILRLNSGSPIGEIVAVLLQKYVLFVERQ
jgi:hypothetical protein